MDTNLRARGFLKSAALPILLLSWLPAAADTFQAPDYVQAQMGGRFQYSWSYIVGSNPFLVAAYGWNSLENTTSGVTADCFCLEFCTVQPGYTIRFLVDGTLTNAADPGLVENWVAGCNTGGGRRLTVILPPTTTDAADPAFDRGFRLSNSPNPCRDHTVFHYSLPESGPAELRLFDATGRWIATPLRGLQEAGTHSVTWKLIGPGGERLPRGVYLARLDFNGLVRVLRIPVIY